MVSILDELEKINKTDAENMLEAIGNFPENARNTLKETDKLSLESIHTRELESLLIIGMGGSAVGGLLLKDWLRGVSEIPINVSRSYDLPEWVNKNTLVYAVSYSGETEETLTQYKQALAKECQIIVFCSGGTMSRVAQEENNPLVIFPKNYKPRAAIASQFYSIANVTHRLGLIPNEKWGEVKESIDLVESLIAGLGKEVHLKDNPAKNLAEAIHGSIPFIYGSKLFETVAYRFSTQFNENSKSPAATNFFPEAFHNSIMAAEGEEKLNRNICGVFILDPLEKEPLKSKIKKFRKILEGNLGDIIEVEACGKGELARMMSAVTIGDFASAYLGILYGEDPSSMDSIIRLKS
jgi:glucose/mannose-6-phosphate isomerase